MYHLLLIAYIKNNIFYMLLNISTLYLIFLQLLIIVHIFAAQINYKGGQLLCNP